MQHKNSDIDSAFLDVIMNMLFLFIVFFVILIVQHNTKKADNNIKSKAEFIVTVTWPDDSRDDVDTYFEDPNGGLVHFKDKTSGLMHLDRDDLGHSNDFIELPNGETVEVKENKEMVSLRGIFKGEYTVNVHMYNKSGVGKYINQPIPVTVMIEKLNPYSVVYYRTVELMDNGDEITVCRFTLDEEGNVVSTNELEKKFTSVNQQPPEAP